MEKEIKLSYALTVCNEFLEIQRLVTFLLENKRREDEIVVLVDLTKNEPTSELLRYLHKLSSNNLITLVEDRFNGHFADWKNRLNRACKGDYIFQIDADELPNKSLIDNLPGILESNPDNEVYLVPRVNTVEGLTPEHIQKWRWIVTRIESPNLIKEKEIDNESEEYRLLKEGGFIIEETEVG